MIIEVKVTPRARKRLIKQEGNLLKCYVMRPAEDGRANEEVIEMIASHFRVARSSVKIISGEKCRLKRISVADVD